MKYRVTYYYLATGMEGNADTHDYGIYEAESEQEAREVVAIQKFPNDEGDRNFFIGCLSAERIE